MLLDNWVFREDELSAEPMTSVDVQQLCIRWLTLFQQKLDLFASTKYGFLSRQETEPL